MDVQMDEWMDILDNWIMANCKDIFMNDQVDISMEECILQMNILTMNEKIEE